ncbi:pimeloyl-ACP methyl ester carboxylesterase [Arthrobacter sp. PvP023]|uniref:alpha/beta fold hydrolase n=1 Tax=Micrococcaceae TaxID=1268 RepID=UPI001AE8BA13|nr:alpha/beta hydrolase [Arthrobacter sp. PvP023]MBP1137886.1 pimeloyl-ACP methyl ester carboxylesterase [Arthrobacter sp. PvP023]
MDEPRVLGGRASSLAVPGIGGVGSLLSGHPAGGSMDGYAELRAFRTTHPYRSLSVGGVEWKYISGPVPPGAEEAGPALLVLGGGFSFGESAFRTITNFEPRFRVIAPSYPAVRTMADLLTGIAAILDAEGIPSANVFGHSLGAGVAHAFARRYPQRVDKLVFSGFGLYTRGHTRLVGAFVRLFSVLPQAALAAFYRPRIARLLEGAEEDERAFLGAYTEDLFAAHTKESALARLAVLLDLAAHPDTYAAASSFERPEDVLLIAASDDRGFTPREREALLATYPGARAHVFGQGGHWAAVTHPTEYDAVVGRFLEGRPPPPRRRESVTAPPPRRASHRRGEERPTASALDAKLAAFRARHRYRTLDVGGLRWRYLAGGSGDQVLLLPSGGTRMPDMYLLLIEALERDFRVLAPAYPAGAGIAGLADGLAAILDAEGVKQADVLGSSFGGFVAQVFARRHPERVRRLVLANTGGPAAAPLPVLPLLIRFLAVLPEDAVRFLTGWNWRRWFVPGANDDPKFWDALLGDILSRLGKEDLLSALREMNDFAHLPAEAVQGVPASGTPPAPVLLIESERDEAFPPRARAALRALYPAAEVRLFAGAGHGVMATRTAEYVGAVREFLRRP